MIVHVIIAQRRHGVPKVVERGGGRAVMMLVVVLVKTVGLVMDAVGVVATAAAGQVVVESTFFRQKLCYVYVVTYVQY